MRIVAILIALTATTAASAAPAEDVAKLSWLAGSWSEETVTTTTQETWLPPMAGVMAGAGQSSSSSRKPRVEHMKITAEPGGVTFTAIVAGQPPTPFVMISGPEGEVIFENKAHDFPQRVIYRRCGEQLCARIEGTLRGEPASQGWRYSRLH